MLRAIKAMYKCTKNILKSATVEASIGVRQGTPSSCLLFILYIDKMVKMVKGVVGTDGFLGNLHMLLLVDDAVVVATSREMCIKKFRVICNFCTHSGMVINENKTKCFVINNEDWERQCLVSGGVSVNYSSKYLYLGAWFTDSAKTANALKLYEATGEAVVNKFSIFFVPATPRCHLFTCGK